PGEIAAEGGRAPPGGAPPVTRCACQRPRERHSSGTRFLYKTRHTVFGLPVPEKTSAENCGVAQSEGVFLCDPFVMGFK
ncbi:hypothetical protein, partial [Nocardiopsis sp. RV163]|uniref:hypothetical protein n=1 Tax=Nocardiopsis sp. RV163 TaxID=1661388 RepID=UPI001F3290CD